MKQFIWNTTETKFTAIVFITEPGNLRAVKEVYKAHNIINLDHKVQAFIRFLQRSKNMQEGYINFYGKSSRQFIYRHYVNVNIKKSLPP